MVHLPYPTSRANIIEFTRTDDIAIGEFSRGFNYFKVTIKNIGS